MIKLRDYQNEAVNELYDRFSRMLKSSKEICIFQAPTGSGKTIVIAYLLRKLVTEQKYAKISIVWIAPRKLDDQSKDKLEKIYHDQILKCLDFENIQDNRIDENEILFLNWESINKTNNIYMMDNERDKNLLNVIHNTKNNGNKLILIIDESHYAAGGEKSSEIIKDLEPDITLEVSATPHLHNFDEIYKVRLNDVIDEGMIKNEVLVNPKFMDIKVGKNDADSIIIEQAMKQRELLKKKFQEEKSDINPLVLIQLPDKKNLMDDKRKDVEKILKENYDITEKNKNLAIWLSEEKSKTLLNIVKNNNEVEVLIFKHAISLGWDCPRASILVVFREYKSFDFTIQTIGRIMRMPELKHYEINTELNKGFVYTNLENINLTEEYAKEYISLYESYRNESLYTPIKLNSIYLKRNRKRTRLSREFVNIFNELTIKKSFKSKIKTNPSKIIKLLLSDGIIPNIDKTGQIKIAGTIRIDQTEKEIQTRFNEFINLACSPYAPYDSSGRIKTALYQFLHNEFGIEKYESKAQKIVLSSDNYQIFWDVINESKSIYKTKVVDKVSKKRERDVTKEWEVPKMMSFKNNCVNKEKNNSIMIPFYLQKSSTPEKNFIDRLSLSDKIKWWYKNGESEKKYFSIPYIDDDGKEMGFYVDFIIQFNDGSIGLFDTKSGITAAGASTRHNGLYKYMQDENKKGKNLIGGIIVELNGVWKYNNNKEYYFDNKNLTDWKILDF